MKTTKKRLQELANLAIKDEGKKGATARLNEVDAKVVKSASPIGAYADVEMTITFVHALSYFNESAEELGFEPDYKNENFNQKLAELIAENLEIWLGNEGGQWIEDGIKSGAYNDLKK